MWHKNYVAFQKVLTCNCVLECMKNEGTFFNFEWLAQRTIWIVIDNHKLKSMNCTTQLIEEDIVSNFYENLAVDIFPLCGMCKYLSLDKNLDLPTTLRRTKMAWGGCVVAWHS